MKGNVVENKISIAPMVDRTDKNFRNFVRMINNDVLLYTEMITAQAILNGDLDYILGFNEIEHPIVLQIAATNPKEAYEAIKIAEKYNYDEINLNVGCPSDRVSGNMMGAYLMAFPEEVANIVRAMKDATSKPISIKHRIGIDGKNILPDSFERTLLDKYEDMMDFINITRRAGVNKYIIHARIAILAGLDPKQNRTIPPLRYDEVYRVKNENPDLHIEINGGIKTIEEIDNHLKYVDSVMLGREIYDNPMILTEFGKYYGKEINITRKEIIEKMIYYVENIEKQSLRPHLFLMHTHGLFHNVRGSKAWKIAINEPKANSDTLRELLKGIENF
ncbi:MULTISPECIES: tRNA dihydrouridine(20/20a) synthase DusA [unclassified Leptotrichia]|uniref:tRNA dihydrouridine(20/20a) synthase DusA n=1 Tax=unclassified Leptotrichia TaxID=2633022 RepID=UPI0003AE5B99|nr:MULTISPECIES: tRNA dihydrouridine(20/20a) synthase DusA [unclassified Leptotrichia]ERL25750.1 tRNA dihydrouridine synthase A [Leptotrichia sp. oral taxon 225 str. F0581]WLD73461.1 tRNA dihydrouridine(20/20a) synthase DusA [Leptotrichia sp. HMT-225]